MNKLKSSHFSTFEKLLTVLGIGLISLGIYLSKNLSNTDLISSELEVVGDTTQGQAKRKTERSFSWADISNKEIVYNNDQIYTSTNQSLNIELENRSFLEISPNSLVRVNIDESKSLGVDIDQGTLKVDANETRQVVRINQSSYVVEVQKGGVVKLERLGGEVFGVKLLKGMASIINKTNGGDVKLNLNEGESTLVNSQEIVTADMTDPKSSGQYTSFLKADEVDLLSQKKISFKANTIETKTEFAYVKPASKRKVIKIPITNGSFAISSLTFGKYLVSTTPSFKRFDSFDVIASKKDPIAVKSKVIDYDQPIDVKLNIREGIKSKVIVEYPKLAKKKEYIVDKKEFSFPSFDQEHVKITLLPIITPSNSISFEKTLDLKLKDPYQFESIKSKSLEDEIVTSIKINRPITSAKHKVKLVDMVRGVDIPLRVSEQGDFVSSNLKSGDYKLEIVNEESDVKLLEKDIKIEEAILIKKKKVYNKRNIIVSSFSWAAPGVSDSIKEAGSKTPSYVVEIFDSANYLVMKKELKDNYINFESKDMKDYKIKVSKKEAGKLKILGEKNFKVKPPKNVNPAAVKKYVMKYDSKNLCYRVKLPYYVTANKYFIEIYRDVKMTKIVREIWSNNSSFCWRSNRDGKYFFRYKYVNYWGSGSKYSDISEIVFPISPLTDF